MDLRPLPGLLSISVGWEHDTEDVLLKCEDFPLLQDTLSTLVDDPAHKGWTVNRQKVQGPGFSVEYLSVIWSPKTKFVPAAVTDKM